jgi:hypothetical protein
MKRRSRGKQALMEALALGLLLAGAIALIVGSSGGPLSRAQLAIQVGELRSDASETALLAEQLAAGRLVKPFAQTHLQLLLDNIREANQSLAKAQPEHRLEGLLELARVRAADVEQSVQRLAADPGGADAIQLDQLRTDLRSAAEALHELEETLKA